MARPRKGAGDGQSHAVEVKRRYVADQVLESDLFKLELSTMQKNLGWRDRPMVEQVEHVHFFRTYDSQGEAHDRSTSIGGHFHMVEWSVDENGDLRAECGPAVNEAQVNVGEKDAPRYEFQVLPVRIKRKGDRDLVDDHTHDCVYLRTDRISMKAVADSAKGSAMILSQGAMPPQGTVISQIKMGDAPTQSE